jgi:Fic/DOC family
VLGQDAYPDLFGKAAALLHSLARNHQLVDGNKRLAWLATYAFLAKNDIELDPRTTRRTTWWWPSRRAPSTTSARSPRSSRRSPAGLGSEPEDASAPVARPVGQVLLYAALCGEPSGGLERGPTPSLPCDRHVSALSVTH